MKISSAVQFTIQRSRGAAYEIWLYDWVEIGESFLIFRMTFEMLRNRSVYLGDIQTLSCPERARKINQRDPLRSFDVGVAWEKGVKCW
jgi:hypothetical protein